MQLLPKKIQKTAESYEKTAVEFNELITDIQKRIDDTGIISGDINEKIRTVTVMTKGVKSAVSDILSEFTELETHGRGMSDLAGEVLSANGIPAAIDTYIETAGNIIHIFEDASDAFCNRDGIFSEVADQSNLLSSSVSRFASEQNVSSALDDIITTTDDLMNAAEQVDDDLEITVKQLSGLTEDMEELERSAEFIGEKLDTISQFTAGVIDNTENIKERLDSVQHNISESVNAIEGIRKELESMVDESRSYDRQLRDISRITGTISDYIATFKGFATILDCISLNGELEVARNSDDSGFSSIPKRCETIAGELTDKLKQLKLFATATEQGIENIGLSANIHYIDKTTEPVKKLQDDLSGVLSREISSLNNSIEKITEIARNLDKTTGSISGNSQDLISLSESTADKVKKITESAANQQSALKKAFETCEKIQAQAEELYPPEGLNHSLVSFAINQQHTFFDAILIYIL
nr:hypothetical protein [uncultured Sulfurimonas sp.]